MNALRLCAIWSGGRAERARFVVSFVTKCFEIEAVASPEPGVGIRAAPVRAATINSYFTCIRRDKHLVEPGGNRYMRPPILFFANSVSFYLCIRLFSLLSLLHAASRTRFETCSAAGKIFVARRGSECARDVCPLNTSHYTD